MARKTGEWTIVHPTTNQQFRVQAIEDGSIRVVIDHEHEAQKWGMTNCFTGGDSGTRMALVRFR